MAQTAASRFKYGDDNFPILYEDHRMRVYTNSSGEVFVENVADAKFVIRIGPDHKGLRVSCDDGQFTPWAFNSFLVRGRS